MKPTAAVLLAFMLAATAAVAQSNSPGWLRQVALLSAPAPAQNVAAAQAEKAAPAPSKAEGDYVGMDTCVTCHDEQHKTFVHTAMGRAFTKPRTPLEARGCEACHGPGKAHVEAGGGKDTIPYRFTKDSKNTVEEQNWVCLQCHQKGNRLFWKGSPHQSRAVACVDCHQGHEHPNRLPLSADARYNSPLTTNTGLKMPQPELCLQCHQMRRAQLQRSSHMPYREGKVTCTSCHNPHGTPNPSQLIQSSINENCLSCHTERRGPFLWEHPPVMENCANCHEPHGSNNPQLLKVRMPRVCDSCHLTQQHPTQPQPLGSIKNFNRGCTNCHSKIHGSNHPSGNFFLR